MTNVTIIYDNNIIIGFEMIGHAGFNTKGPDILCASLSAASQLTVNGLIDQVGVMYDDLVLEACEKQGTLFVMMPDDIHYNMAAQHIYKSFELYVEMLADEYPDYVRVERSYLDD